MIRNNLTSLRVNIARDVFSHLLDSSTTKVEAQEAAQRAVSAAELLIAELQKPHPLAIHEMMSE